MDQHSAVERDYIRVVAILVDQPLDLVFRLLVLHARKQPLRLDQPHIEVLSAHEQI